ncbi:hypothetical protein [Streptomyces sp. NPDC057748]|uniref:hypothetical protein n=1 Tax=unclassified Streptomyces TaxID=2593676 RepID=UPI0036739B99
MSDAWRCNTGKPAGSCPSGADGTTPPGAFGSAATAPMGNSRRGLPRAGRTGAAAGRSAVWPVGRAGADVVPAVATGVTGAETTEASGGRIPAICRNAIAGRRAMIRGGAVRRGRTAAGRARWSETGADDAVPAGCCDADAATGPRATSVPGAWADGVPLARAVLLAGAAPAVLSRSVAPPPRLCRPGAPFPEERVVVAPPDR